MTKRLQCMENLIDNVDAQDTQEVINKFTPKVATHIQVVFNYNRLAHTYQIQLCI